MQGRTSEALIVERADLLGEVDAKGYAIRPGLSVGRRTECVAEDLGEILTPWDDTVKQVLIPRAASPPNTYSGIFGLDCFPFHTDLAHWPLPPRYLLLRCVRGYADVPTLLLDGRAMAAVVGHDTMARALVKPRRPQSGELRIHRLLQTVDCREIVRWDEIYLQPASPVGSEASTRFKSLIDEAAPAHAVMINDGDVLVIDNWRMLHARPAIAPGRQDRKLERVYLRSLK
jgi:L-asparagine oxygenase